MKRLKRATKRELAIYSRADLTVQVQPLGDITLEQVIRTILDRPMTTTEIAVAVLKAGYVTLMSKTAFRDHVRLQLNRSGFKQDGGKWTGDQTISAYPAARSSSVNAGRMLMSRI